MPQGETDGDDLAVNLSWPGAAAVVPERRPKPQPPEPPPRPRPRRPADEAEPRARQTPTRQPPVRQAPPPQPAARPAPATAALRPDDGGATNGSVDETMLSILEHLSTLSRLVTGTSKASTAELDALGKRVEKAVADLDALQLRVLRSLAGFDALRLRVQKELADRPPLTDDDVDRIADAVTDRLLASVRVETEGGTR